MAWESSAWNLDFVRGDGSLPRHGKKMKLSAGRRTEGMGSGWFQARLKVGGGDAARPGPCSSGLLASTSGVWALVSFSESITSEKAEHADAP